MNAQRLNTAKLALWRSMRNLCPGFVVDEHNAAALNAVAHWLVQEEHPMVDPDKGLLIRGPVGTGKSDLMRGIAATCVTGGGEGFPVVSAKRIVYEYSRNGDRVEQGTSVIMRYADLPALCIDDIGTEEDGKHFGKTVNAIADLIAFRYDRWRIGRSITHITTNLDNAALSDKYDERTVSRIGEMMSAVPMSGDDRRQMSTPRPVERARLFDYHEPDVLAKEQAMERLAEIKATIDRINEAKNINNQPQP